MKFNQNICSANSCIGTNVFDKCKLTCCASVYFPTSLNVNKNDQSVERKRCVGFAKNGYYQM